ncbi:unnamed protein product [Dibothriocephalus latus]|uniref:Bromo domain-containing protein n=1 Tax=Dibothriocephalus latus TaxID=60516 RepID=A0A3P7M6R9_DIBLA|nr:unnamed protein product [Dibothriocephalus latus]
MILFRRTSETKTEVATSPTCFAEEKQKTHEDTKTLNDAVSALADRLCPVLEAVKAHKLAGPFLRPVTAAEAPGYFSLIVFPMDLRTMSERLKNRYYVQKELFIADMRRILLKFSMFAQRAQEIQKIGFAAVVLLVENNNN